MELCKICGMPDTRPGSQHINSVCMACRNYECRSEIDYKHRQYQLSVICDEIKKKKLKYDCVCPVSGGKDSHVIVGTLVEQYGMKPLLVTVADEFTKTAAGKHNHENIARRFNLDHITFRHEPMTFRNETLKDFETELHPLKWIEQKIYETPVKIAEAFGIPYVFYGENSAYEYGSSTDCYMLHSHNDRVSVFYFFAFYPYVEIDVMNKAKTYGYKTLSDFDEWFRHGSIEDFTQIDSLGYIIQLFTKFPKFGFQRVADITSRMVRKGQMTKEQADLLVKERDWVCDPASRRDFCKTLNISEQYFNEIVDKFANREILYKDANDNWRRKDL